MDLSVIKIKIDMKKKYKLEEFHSDVTLMLNNCFSYNESFSDPYKV
jgi:hypothetical protein